MSTHRSDHDGPRGQGNKTTEVLTVTTRKYCNCRNADRMRSILPNRSRRYPGRWWAHCAWFPATLLLVIHDTFVVTTSSAASVGLHPAQTKVFIKSRDAARCKEPSAFDEAFGYSCRPLLHQQRKFIQFRASATKLECTPAQPLPPCCQRRACSQVRFHTCKSPDDGHIDYHFTTETNAVELL